MFAIKLVDIGSDGLVTGFKTSVDTLPEVELIATELVSQHINRFDIELIHDDELVYEVFSGGVSIGVVEIRTI